jgi:hypothetical protein
MPDRRTVEEMREIARNMGGECNSTEYVNNKTKIEWKCAQGHTWKSVPACAIKGHWCPICAAKTRNDSQRLSIGSLKNIADTHHGKCLSTVYHNNRTKLLWECERGHRWCMTPSHVKDGQWCPRCVGRYPTVDEIKAFAVKSGGKCLSDIYIGHYVKMSWECENGHQWRAVWRHVKSGTWCPKCKLSVGETICKGYFERIFNAMFHKSRPSWLRSENGKLMELDGYNKDLKIAFEYQGEQHYRAGSIYTRDQEDLELRITRDQIKANLCKDKGIVLIQVPYTIKYKEMQNFIIYKYEEMTGSHLIVEKFDHHSFSKYRVSELEEMNRIAKEKNGECLSTFFINAREHLTWKCNTCGNIWNAAPYNIKIGRWCPRCAHTNFGNRKYSIEYARKLARENGGECLSIEYIRDSIKLKWRCKNGHTWRAKIRDTKKEWCPICNPKVTVDSIFGFPVNPRRTVLPGCRRPG